MTKRLPKLLKPMNNRVPKSMSHSFQEQATKRVSFILTTLNHAAFIGSALEMARELIKPQDELIVIDGASTDGTLDIINSKRDIIDLFISEPDLSPIHALNKGMLVARGKYIKHLTDDDQFFPDAMEKAIAVLESNPDIGILLCGGMRQFGSELTPVYVPPGVDYGKNTSDPFRYGICGCGIVLRRDTIAQTGLVNHSSIAADGEYIAQAIRNDVKVRFSRIKLFIHPIYEHSYIMLHQSIWQQDRYRIVKQYCSKRFYWRYRIFHLLGTIVRKSILLRGPARILVRLIGPAIGKPSMYRNQIEKTPLIWDGGFS